MKVVTVTSKGQIAIPAKTRLKYKIEKGTKLCVMESGLDIVLRPVSDDVIDRLAGSLKDGGKAMRYLREERKRDRDRENGS
jgi:AbrB family looped-hinge helix DNA binding protein